VNRIDHGVLGAASGLLYAKAAQLGVGESVAAGAAAWVFSRGRLSPDGDQYGPLWTREGWLLRLLGRLASWKVLGRLWTVYARLLVFALGGTLFPSWREKAQAAGDPAGHRRITHWWGNAAFAGAVLTAGSAAWPGLWWFLPWAGLIGWSSHLTGDALFGRKVWGTDGHGIPLGPWWRYWSPVPQQFRGRPVKGLRSDGLTAHCFALGVAAPASAFLLLSIAGI
jgi:membrane-bound metal-dependent hydrolase YbcI (DUF457 family)